MGAILLDNETGDVYLDEYNNTVPVDNDKGFKQIINGLLHCDLGSEIMNVSYGFDLKAAIRESSFPNSEMNIESLLVQALDSQQEKIISKLEYVKATQDDRTMNVIIEVTSILNDNIRTELNLGE